MSIFEIGCIFYGMTKHFDSNFNFCDYQYKLPENMLNSARKYCERHRYSLDKFSCFSRQNVIVFAIVNQLRYRSGMDIWHMDEKDTIWFFGLLEHYKNDFLLDIELIGSKITKIRDIYDMHVAQEIRWFTMPVLFKYLKYNPETLIDDVPLVKELRWQYRALYILKLDEAFFKENIESVQKKLDLMCV